MKIKTLFPGITLAIGLSALAGCAVPPQPAPYYQPVAGPAPLPAPMLAPGPLPIGERIANQEQRVTEDARSGRLPPFAVRRARENLASIRGEFERFRRVDGGAIGPGQFAELNRRLDNTLRFIETNER